MIKELAAEPGKPAIIQPASPPEFDRRIEHGRRIIEAAFDKSVSQKVPAGIKVFGPDRGSNLVYRLKCGWAYRAIDWPDGRCAIIDTYLPGDIVGLEAAVLGHPIDEVVAITTLTVQAIDAPMLTELLASPSAAAISWLLAEQQQRVARLAAALARRDAHERLALMLTDFYDRLHQRALITSSSYALPLTQQQIGDHLGLTLVHVNRVLRSLREKGIVSIDRHVVTIRDLDRLRQLAANGRADQHLSAERPPGPREPTFDRAKLDEMALILNGAGERTGDIESRWRTLQRTLALFLGSEEDKR